MDQQELCQHEPELRQIATSLHRVTSLIVLITFSGYGLALWLFFSNYRLEGLIAATAFYIFFRFFRHTSLMVIRRGVAKRPELQPAMEWLDVQIKRDGASRVMSELDQRLFAEDKGKVEEEKEEKEEKD
jgi:hypothetical protein